MHVQDLVFRHAPEFLDQFHQSLHLFEGLNTGGFVDKGSRPIHHFVIESFIGIVESRSENGMNHHRLHDVFPSLQQCGYGAVMI